MIGSRIKELIDLLKHNSNSFAQEIGVASTIIYNVTGRRKSSPSFEVLEKIKNTFPIVNMNWLITGEGTPLLEITPESNEIKVQISGLTNRMQQLEELANIRDRYISVLQNKVESLKDKVESVRSVS